DQNFHASRLQPPDDLGLGGAFIADGEQLHPAMMRAGSLDAKRGCGSPALDLEALMFRTLKTTLPLATALMLAAAPAALAQNLMIRGGTIHTGDEAQPTAEVVAVRDGRIAYVGAAAGAPSAEGLEVV